MIENIDYKFVFPANDDKTVHIKLLQGPYKDTIYKYGQVKFDEKDGDGYLLFDYDVIESTVMKPKKLEKDEDFKNVIGDLLVEMISTRLTEEVDETGTTDTEESD